MIASHSQGSFAHSNSILRPSRGPAPFLSRPMSTSLERRRHVVCEALNRWQNDNSSYRQQARPFHSDPVGIQPPPSHVLSHLPCMGTTLWMHARLGKVNKMQWVYTIYTGLPCTILDCSPPNRDACLQVRACSATSIADVPPVLQRSDSLDYSTALSLDNIRQSLIRQEDTIIFSLIERAQFAANEPVYQPGAIAVPGKSPPDFSCVTRVIMSFNHKLIGSKSQFDICPVWQMLVFLQSCTSRAKSSSIGWICSGLSADV